MNVSALDLAAQDRTIQRVAWRLIPIMMLLYFIAFIDRVKDTRWGYMGGLLATAIFLAMGAAIVIVTRAKAKIPAQE